MADVVGQAEEKERRLNKSRKKLERKLVGNRLAFSGHPLPSTGRLLDSCHRPQFRNVPMEKPTCRHPSFDCEHPRGPGVPKRSPPNTRRDFSFCGVSARRNVGGSPRGDRRPRDGARDGEGGAPRLHSEPEQGTAAVGTGAPFDVRVRRPPTCVDTPSVFRVMNNQIS